jgi:DNA helicase-2/ATP-dependent DNA helicase PcrA
MQLTKQQRAAVDCKESAAIKSCPGSGKTRTIVSKLLACLEEVSGTSRRVAAITYTNAAVGEIESRLRDQCTHDERIYYEVSTIHSFCLNNVFRPFHDFLHEFRTGFTLMPPEDERWQAKTAELVDSYSISRWAQDGFEQVQRMPNGRPAAPEGIPGPAAEDLCEWCDQNAYISLCEIVYHSFRLIRENPFIASGLSSRFKWMLVDEFQDSSAIQVEILKRIAGFGRTRFFVVGDPHQSIYRFAGADSGLMEQFAEAVGARTDLQLSGNFRSCPGVIEAAEALCGRSPRMRAVGEYKGPSQARDSRHRAGCSTL